MWVYYVFTLCLILVTELVTELSFYDYEFDLV